MASKKDLENQQKMTKLQKEQLALLQKIAGLEKSITAEKKENKIFSEAIADSDNSAQLAAMAREKAEQGRLNYAKGISGLATIEADMMKELQTGAIELETLFSNQEEILKNINEEHEAELAAAKEAGMGQEALNQLQEVYREEAETIKDIMQEQVDKAIELNEEMDRQLATGETVRDRLMTQNDTLKAQEGVLGDIKKGAQKYIGIFTNGQAAFAFIVNKLFEMGKAARDLAQETGVSYANAAKLQGAATITATKYALMGMKAEDVTKAQSELLALGYSIDQVLDGAADSVAYMAKRFGISNAEAAKLQKTLAGMNGHSQEAADAMLEQAVALAKANKVAPGVVVSEMAANAGEFAAAGEEGFGAMAATAVAAKKLGVEMSTIATLADGLLDVQSSIEAEMQAQVMTGRSINLNRARELANANNLVDMTKELVNQLGSYEDFTRMTRLEQEAYAGAVGMSRGELAKMLQNATKLEGLTAAQKEHYNQTGEILEENDSLLTAENATLAASIATGIVAIGQIAAKGVGLVKNLMLEKAITKEKKKQTKAGKPGGTPGKGFNVKSALKAAAAMLIIAAAMFVFAKAAQQFGDDINWSNVAMGSGILIVLGLAAALIGNMSAQVIKGALAMAILGVALIPAAFAFSLLAGVDAGAILAMSAAIIVLSAAALVIGSIMMSGVGAVAFAAGAAAIALLGLAIIPFAGALSMLEGVDVAGTMSGIVQLAMVAPLLALAGVGMSLLGLGTLGFAAAMYLMAPVIETAIQFSDLIVKLAPGLAALGAVGAGLLAIGPALGLIGLGLIPFTFGLLALSFAQGMIPIFGKLAPILTEMAPAVTALAAAGQGMFQLGAGFAAFAGGLLLMVPALYALMPLMPTLLLLGSIVGKMGGLGAIMGTGGEGEEKSTATEDSGGNQEIIAKLDQLIAVIQQPGTINMDGRKVGEVLHMAKGLART